MRRPLTALVFLVLAALLGSTLAAGAATPNDVRCRRVVSGSVSTKELMAYDACRFDRLDAEVAALRTDPAPSSGGTAQPTASASPTSVSKPSPTSTPTATTPPTPGTSATKPGPTNTGVPAGTVLTPYTGPMRITTAGTVIENKDVSGGLRIEAKNVVIKNSKVHGSDEVGIYTTDTGSATITDTEIYGFQTGLVYSNFTALRVNLHDLSYDGVKLSSNAKVQDSWIHAPRPSADAHWDGIQVQDGVVNTVIQGNNIEATAANANSALFLCPDLGPSTNGPLTVQGNWLSGGNFTVATLDGNNGKYFIKVIVIKDNKFGSKGQYGYSNVNVPIIQSGNLVEATGAPYTL